MITISVTAEHIESGEHKNCLWCPVARAVSGFYGHDPGITVWVYSSSIEIHRRNHETDSPSTPLTINAFAAALVPLKVAQFINAFDDGRPVRPFEFQIDLPEMITATHEPGGNDDGTSHK
jgi:hypothetical protein